MVNVKSHLWIFALLVLSVGIGGAVLSLLISWGMLTLFQDVFSLLPKKILPVFGVTLAASIFSTVLMLKLAVSYIAKKTAILESEVKYYAISLSAAGILVFLVSFLFIGDLWSGMGAQRFLFSGVSAFGLGVILFIAGIIWLDEKCMQVSEVSEVRLHSNNRRFASLRDVVFLLIVLLLVGALFFVAANRSYLAQKRMDRDTAKLVVFPALTAAVQKYFQEQGVYPGDLKELPPETLSGSNSYLYYYCKEQGYYHLGVALEYKKSFALGMDRDAVPCDEKDFSGKDPVLDVVGRAESGIDTDTAENH